MLQVQISRVLVRGKDVLALPCLALPKKTKGPKGSRLGRPAQGGITAFALKSEK